jgi:hypothetical protein
VKVERSTTFSSLPLAFVGWSPLQPTTAAANATHRNQLRGKYSVIVDS